MRFPVSRCKVMFYFSEYNIVSFELLQKEDIDDIIILSLVSKMSLQG